MTINNLGEIDGSLAEQRCNDVLVSVGLSPLWHPDPSDLPTDLTALGTEVHEAVGHDEVSGEKERSLIEKFGHAVVAHIPDYFSNFNSQAPFRAHTAIKKGAGSCVAASETVRGVLSELGFGGRAATMWYGKHASTLFDIGGVVLELDGFNKKVYSTGLSRLEKLAARAVIQKDIAVLSSGNLLIDHKTTVDTLPVEELHSVTVDPNEGLLMLPSSYATLMFCGLVARESKNPKYQNAARVLKPYAPVAIQ